MLNSKFNKGDIVLLNNREHTVLHFAQTTAHIDNDVNKEEYLVEELYMLSDIHEYVDVSRLSLVRAYEEDPILKEESNE